LEQIRSFFSAGRAGGRSLMNCLQSTSTRTLVYIPFTILLHCLRSLDVAEVLDHSRQQG
jgi:hypothetical protein